SLRARALVPEVSPGELGPQPPAHNPMLTACQGDAAAGLYAASLAGYLHWLAPRLEDVRGRLREGLAELRGQASRDGQHARTPGIVADLAIGLRLFLEFAQSLGAITSAEREDLWQRGWAALCEAAEAHAANLGTAEPAGLFLRLIRATLASGRAHVADL